MYVQLTVVYVVSERQDDSFTMCSNVKGQVEFMSIRSLQENFRAFEVLSNTIRPHFTGKDSECLNDAFNNYVNLWQEGKTYTFETLYQLHLLSCWLVPNIRRICIDSWFYLFLREAFHQECVKHYDGFKKHFCSRITDIQIVMQ